MKKKRKFKIGMIAVIYMLILYIMLGSTFGGCAKDFYKEYKGVAYRNSDSHAEHLGYFFSDDNLDQITIALMEEKDNYKYDWRPVDGLIFSGNASGRTEAVEITRKLMAKSMYGEYM
jgi:hypothetical protein